MVDEEPIAREMTDRALAEYGFLCDTAAEGGEALSLLEENEYDVLVTDLKMPGINGHALCVEVLRRPDRPVLVVLTGIVELEITDDLRHRGVDQIFFKPVDLDAFAERVKRLVAGGPGRHLRQREVNRTAPVWESEQPGTAGAGGPLPSDQRAAALAKQTVLVLLKDGGRCRRLAEAINTDRIAAVAFSNSEDLHETLNQKPVEMVVIEEELGGFFRGTEILSRIYDELVRPETILLCRSPEAIRETSDSLGISRVLSSDTSGEDIAAAVQSMLSGQSAGQELIAHQARKLVQEYDGLPPIPQVLVRMVSYMDSPLEEIPLKELADDIAIDAKVTAALLKMANSSSAGVSRVITNIFDALTLLGAKRAIALVLANAAVGAQDEMLRGWSTGLRNWYYQRSVLIACTASVFAAKLSKVSPDTSFVLGLLQDIGILVLLNSYPQRYEAILERFHKTGHMKLERVEKEDFGITHADVSAALLQKWDLPKTLVSQVLIHHQQKIDRRLSRTERSLLQVMRIGNALANLADLAHPYRRQILNRMLSEYPEEKLEVARACIKEAVVKTVESCKILSLPEPDFEQLSVTVRQVASSLQTAEQGA